MPTILHTWGPRYPCSSIAMKASCAAASSGNSSAESLGEVTTPKLRPCKGTAPGARRNDHPRRLRPEALGLDVLAALVALVDELVGRGIGVGLLVVEPHAGSVEEAL